jgi:hypothetical protein
MNFSQSIDQAVGAYFNHWFQEHWLVWWLISNPGWSLGMLLLAIVLLVNQLRQTQQQQD